jgi:ribose transport system ATP-binding protein
MIEPFPETTPEAPALRAEGIGKSFGGVAALSDVDLTIRAGEILGLSGANGAGKSTLINVLTGQLTPDTGTLSVKGVPVTLDAPLRAAEHGIGVVRQELDLVPDLTIAENLALGDERRFRRRGMLDRASMNEAASAALARVGLDIPPSKLVRDLAIGDQQLVAAARALRSSGTVLLLDEPTSSLTPFEAERLFTVMRSLRDDGVGVVFISHRLNEVSELCDRVVVLRDGRVAGEFGVDAASMDDIVEAMVPGAQSITRRTDRPDIGDVVLSAGSLGVHGRKPLDLELRAGEVVGLFGLVGAGKSSLARVFAGLLPPTSGTMTIAGRAYRPRDAADAFALGIAYLSEDRRSEGILPQLSVRQNIVVRTPRDTAPAGVLRSDAITHLVREMFDRLRIKAASDSLDIRDLSGGNQQKVLLARLLAEDLRVLILDEPTHGIDVQAKHDLLTTVGDLTRKGISVLIVSSEIPELLAACDRILVMRKGDVVASLSAEESTEQLLMSAATGGTR